MVVRPLLLHGDTDRIIIPFFPKKHKAGLLLFAGFSTRSPQGAALRPSLEKCRAPSRFSRCVSLKRVIE